MSNKKKIIILLVGAVVLTGLFTISQYRVELGIYSPETRQKDFGYHCHRKCDCIFDHDFSNYNE